MLKVINPGILTTIQDQGRKNYRSFGVPISGVMDHYAANCANYLLGNSEKEAVIEITMGGVTFDVMEDTDISVTGGDLNGLINEQPLPMWKKLTVHSGDQLTFKGPKSGMRTYIALPGGIESTSYLGSQSTFEKAGFGKAFQKGDNIKVDRQQRRLPNPFNQWRSRRIQRKSRYGLFQVIMRVALKTHPFTAFTKKVLRSGQLIGWGANYRDIV